VRSYSASGPPTAAAMRVHDSMRWIPSRMTSGVLMRRVMASAEIVPSDSR